MYRKRVKMILLLILLNIKKKMNLTDEILVSLHEEFDIFIKKSNDGNIRFFKDGNSFVCEETSLWGCWPLDANIKYVCDKMRVIYKDSNTEKLCNKLEEYQHFDSLNVEKNKETKQNIINENIYEIDSHYGI